jgi:hypothetical protein
MQQYFTEIEDLKFTAGMEQKLDAVEDGSVAWKDVLRDFYYNGFEENLKEAEAGERKMVAPTVSEEICPVCGKPLTMNLRSDDRFVEDEGWHAAAERYQNFLRTRISGKILFLEIGVGYNTPVIIKYPFWQMTNDNPKAVYACLNYNEAFCPKQIEKQSICLDGDAGAILDLIK